MGWSKRVDQDIGRSYGLLIGSRGYLTRHIRLLDNR